jgi:hypothetical protein
MQITPTRQSTYSLTVIFFAIIVVLALIAYKGERMQMQQFETRLQQLDDREQIRELIVDYGRCLDGRDFDAFSKLFAEKEGEWIGGMGKAKGSQAVRELMEKSIGSNSAPQNANFHLFTNEKIRLAGDRASATTKWIFVIKGESNRPQPVFLGHYQDDFVREKGDWKFLRREVFADIPTDDLLSRGK